MDSCKVCKKSIQKIHMAGHVKKHNQKNGKKQHKSKNVGHSDKKVKSGKQPLSNHLSMSKTVVKMGLNTTRTTEGEDPSPLVELLNGANQVGDSSTDVLIQTTFFLDLKMTNAYNWALIGAEIDSISGTDEARITRLDLYLLQQGSVTGATTASTFLIVSNCRGLTPQNEIINLQSRTVTMVPSSSPKYVKVNSIDYEALQDEGYERYGELGSACPELIAYSIVNPDDGATDTTVSFQAKVVITAKSNYTLVRQIRRGTGVAQYAGSSPALTAVVNAPSWKRILSVSNAPGF